jgi:hypothetical protein
MLALYIPCENRIGSSFQHGFDPRGELWPLGLNFEYICKYMHTHTRLFRCKRHFREKYNNYGEGGTKKPAKQEIGANKRFCESSTLNLGSRSFCDLGKPAVKGRLTPMSEIGRTNNASWSNKRLSRYTYSETEWADGANFLRFSYFFLWTIFC